MKSIGGYFELEVTGKAGQYHTTLYAMKNGRAALYMILHQLQPSLVYIPYYTCDAVLAPFKEGGVRYDFYEINERLEPANLPRLKDGEYFLYINYFGIKGAMTAVLSEQYKDRLIVDATQAFFMKGDGVSWLFNSCRKFFGVPDGAYLYVPDGAQVPVPEERNKQYITGHLLKRRSGSAQEGYPLFVENEELMDCKTQAMSEFTEEVMGSVDYEKVVERRMANFRYLHGRLKDINLFDALLTGEDIPMCYPLLLPEATDKRILYAQNIFVPTFWGEVKDRVVTGYITEKGIAERLLPLPVDHRYDERDMEYIVTWIHNLLKQSK